MCARGGVNGGCLPQRQTATVQTLPQGHTTINYKLLVTQHNVGTINMVGSVVVVVVVWEVGIPPIDSMDFLHKSG